MTQDVKNNMGFYRYSSQKRKNKETVPLLIIETNDLVTTDLNKAEVFNNFLPQFSLTISISTSFESLSLKAEMGNKVPHIVVDQLRDHMKNLNI